MPPYGVRRWWAATPFRFSLYFWSLFILRWHICRACEITVMAAAEVSFEWCLMPAPTLAESRKKHGSSRLIPHKAEDCRSGVFTITAIARYHTYQPDDVFIPPITRSFSQIPPGASAWLLPRIDVMSLPQVYTLTPSFSMEFDEHSSSFPRVLAWFRRCLSEVHTRCDAKSYTTMLFAWLIPTSILTSRIFMLLFDFSWFLHSAATPDKPYHIYVCFHAWGLMFGP